MPYTIGVDLGGTNLRAGLVAPDGTIVYDTKIDTRVEEGPQAIIGRIVTLIKQVHAQLPAGAELDGVGIGVPGPLDPFAGFVFAMPNIPGFENTPLRSILKEATHLDIELGNDANAAAYGEFWVGSGRDYKSLILLTLGTGVGGGIIVGDVNIDGAHSHGSECGHLIVDTSNTARLCPCGHAGHLEAYCSATSLVKMAGETIDAGADGSLADAVRGGEKLTPILVAREAEAGDRLAHDLIMEVARWLGIGITSLMHVVDPEAVIIGGAMTFGRDANPVGRSFLDAIRAEVHRRTFPTLAANTILRYATLGGDAGSFGAAGLARLQHLG
jgi:glucokinase